jgi:enolase
VTLGSGATGRGMAPAGASRGSREAIDLRDGGSRFGGFDVQRAIAAVNGDIARALAGRDALDQRGVDRVLIECDGTPDKSRLGGNALIATSLAVLSAAANARGLPLWRHLAGDAPAGRYPRYSSGGLAHRRVWLGREPASRYTSR